MSNTDFIVFIVDDDPGVLKALSRLLNAAGYRTGAFSSAQAFLSGHDPSIPGCLVLDFSMPDLNGLQLQAALSAAGISRPIVFVTGKGDIVTSVRAMKEGAVDFLTKPVSRTNLLAAIARAQQLDVQARELQREKAAIHAGLARLTAREREVFGLVVAGRLNKQIAADLGTVEKTVKVHRARMMHKLGVHTVQDLVRLAERVDIRPPVPNDRSNGGLPVFSESPPTEPKTETDPSLDVECRRE
ncbi:MAG TPA: response regulator [Xanthobacteraceae bacterium]|jgi:FixJ family two-component response regulator|nr:response regulator [Xanthobacteraceae bacterium]